MSYLNRAFSSVTALALVLSSFVPLMAFPDVAHAASSIEFTSSPPEGCIFVGGEVVVAGIATADAPPGQLQQYKVDVNWGDGSNTLATIEGGTFGSGQGMSTKTFSASHTYTSAGAYSIVATVYHQSINGEDNVDTEAQEYEICVVPDPETYTLTYAAGVGGTISGDAAQEVEEGEDGAEVIAIPDGGYSFVSWSDGVLTAARTDTNVMSDISVTANFEEDAVETGSITVKKNVVDSDGVTDVADNQTFTVSLDGANNKSFAEGSDAVYADLAPGEYTLAELADPNYTYVSGAGSVEVVAGQETVVTIVNKQNEVEVPTGSITVCKVVLDAEGNVITGAEGTTFTIPGLTPDPETSVGAPHGALPNTVFTAPLVLNQKILAASEGNDAQCVTYDGLMLDTVGNTGGYYYAQEQIDSAIEWLTPKYNDQWSESVLDLSDFFSYDNALFDENPENDEERNSNADGHVTLSTQRPDRTLVVLNQIMEAPVCDEEASQTIVSDALTLEGDDASVPVSPINAAWTASIPDATWIWGENPVSDSIETTSQTFTRTFTIVGTPTGATLDIAADNTYSVSINGNLVGSDLSEQNYNLAGQDEFVIPAEYLVSGENTITITVTNIGLDESTPLSNPAGLLYKLVVTNNECIDPPPAPACSDKFDNDQDGKFDAEDPGCLTDGVYNPEDDDETDPTTPPSSTDVCSNIEGNQETVPEGMTESGGICEEESSGGNGGGSRRRGEVLGASTTGEVLGASCGLYMDRYLKQGGANDEVQVVKLQAFLNRQGLFNHVPTGVYGQRTENAVKDFQEKYFADILTPWGLTAPTGLTYVTTLYKINMIECPELTLKLPPLVPWSGSVNTTAIY